MKQQLFTLILLLVIGQTLFAQTAKKPHIYKLDGAVSGIDVTKSTIVIVPWKSKQEIWDKEHPRLFTFVEGTVILGETSATVDEIKEGAKVVESYHITGISSEGIIRTKFEIKDLSQLLHRRVTVYWYANANLTSIGLPLLMPGESLLKPGDSLPGVMSSDGFIATVPNDDVPY